MATDTTDRRLVAVVLLALGALLVLPTLAGFGMMGFGTMYGPMMGGGMWGDGGTVPTWMPLAGLFLQVTFLVVLVGGAYLAYRAVGDSGGTDPALEELRLAYARGDLTDEEYENRREALERE